MENILYITSGKTGIPRFTYNELIELEKKNLHFTLCLTQLKPGPWMPDKKWPVLSAKSKHVFLGSLFLIISKPLLFFNLVRFSIQESVFPYFLMAVSFNQQIKNKKAVTSIHCQMADKKLYIGYFLKRIQNKPLSTTLHAHELYQRKIYDAPQKLKYLFSQCDKIITISEFNKNLLIEKLDLSPDKIRLMRLFPVVENLEKLTEKTKILIVANWAEKKGFKTLIEAVKKLDRKDFIVWIVGGTYYSENSINLNQLIKEYQVEENFLILGRLGGNVLDLVFSSCDIFCLPSFTEYYEDGMPKEREGIPVALMEAMAWGKPVISTHHAGIPELVHNILVEERNVDQLAEAIEFYLENKNLWSEMGKKNQKQVNQNYTKENVQVLMDTFKSLNPS